MRFQVPQFIEVEDKIFGPLTLKQFIYLAGGAGLSFVIYVFINNIFISFIPMAIVMAISAGLAFYPKRTYGRPLIDIIESGFKYLFGTKLYIWKKVERPQPKDQSTAIKDAKNYASIMVPKIADSKLKDLAWSLDIKESMYSNKNQK